MSKILARKIQHSKLNFDILVVIGNGGLFGGYQLAQLLGIKEVVVFNFKSYKGKTRGKIKDNNTVLDTYALSQKKKVLIFDDLVDSGKTMIEALKYFNRMTSEVYTAVWLKKECSQFNPDFYVRSAKKITWIDFNYETY